MKKQEEKNKKIILSSLLASFYGAGLSEDQELKADAAISEPASAAASITGEIPAKRDRFVKQFAMSDGSYTASTYSIKGDVGNATGYMYCKDNSKIIARETSFYDSGNDILVSELTRKKMRKLTFSCCNTANPDCYNIADAFIATMNVRQVDGFDGGAYFNYETNTLEMGHGSQPTWWRYVPKTLVDVGYVGWVPYYQEVATRERMGMRTYRYGRWSKLIMRQNEGGNWA